jgi:amino acid transporter
MIINLRGVKETGTVQNVIVAFKLTVLLFIGFLGIMYFKGDNYSPFTLKDDPYGLATEDVFGGLSGIVIGSAVIFVSYEGYQVIANTVEEMKNPARDVKIGMYISVITVTITYCVVTIATFSLVDKDEVIDEAALIQAVEFLGPWAVLLITLGAAASTTSAINATLLGSSRLAYVMSDWQAFPKKLAVISRKSKVPYLAIITTSAISWFFTFFGNAEEIAEVGSIIFLGIFLSINLA